MKGLPFRPQAVIFDMDGVITDTMGFHFKAWKKALSAYGLKAGYCDIYLREGQKGLDTALEMMQEQHQEVSEDKAHEILRLKEDIFKKISRPRLMKGSPKLLADLKKEGYKLALVTGTARREVGHILPDELLELFDFTLTGNEVKSGKPDPEPYLKALDALKLPAKETVVIENAPFGITSAKGAGIYCIAVCTYLEAEYLKKADLILKNLQEVDKVLLKAHRQA
jgi:beta-phosphoglucomutase